MWTYTIKVALSAGVIVAVSELAKRSSLWAAVLASLPLTSLLAFVWLRLDGGDGERIAQLSTGIFWLVMPSLLLFALLPVLLRAGVDFWIALGLACAATVGAYVAMVAVLARLGIRL